MYIRISDSFCQNVSHDIVSSALSELRERRRLLIENNITSTQFHAARRLSDEVMGQIFTELQDEAENSISDAEKLSKIPVSVVLNNHDLNLVNECFNSGKLLEALWIVLHHREMLL